MDHFSNGLVSPRGVAKDTHPREPSDLSIYPQHLSTLTPFEPRFLTPLSGGNVRSANSVSFITFLTVYHENESSSLVNPGG
ncbi:uncharacterized protein AKAW2_31096S [Aspergillus luchuensis]|uniref:Uncharacterized protein n=1 Tax=Aspergillus kawachii TaxID=1069201 RepID=A0A7R7W7G1_ASPKA|nr:uncharacterized protein AKAW2_31096S [Aspergillus luchuensis]BCR97777.1 hypothetical protein AKAW2_31096S [Aspergillus luchuensis]